MEGWRGSDGTAEVEKTFNRRAVLLSGRQIGILVDQSLNPGYGVAVSDGVLTMLPVKVLVAGLA